MDSNILLKDLATAVEQLDDALAMNADNDVLKAGCIQYFEFCFELAWKTVKRLAEEDGQNDCSSPKAALKQAFANGWITEEEIWLNMLSARNRMSHTYNAKDALSVFDSLPGYLSALKTLLIEFKNNQ
ncbi:MAG: nucleotidyltransferase substrate binding protein [Kiritimatiellales bacterium]|nr:nucleotidyltransferase substrate binding protein [Kiritimatiellales bacterium]MCF7863210.1 nucleotidyltransferase substrate binding protein [Kiritimatiellales bacterium]